MALLSKNTKDVPPPIPGQTRSVRVENPDWQGGLKQAGEDNIGSGRFDKPTVDETYTDTAFSDRILGPRGLGKREDRQETNSAYTEEMAAADANRAIQNAQTTSRMRSRSIERRRVLASKVTAAVSPAQMAARIRATAINTAALSWAAPMWLTVQLPFAILGIVTLGVVGWLQSITSGQTGFLGWLQGLANNVLHTIATVIGWDFADIALGFYFITYVIVLAMGLITILFLYFQYTIALLKPLGGTGEGLKMGMLLLAIIGYCTPVANMFPFILLWVAAVWIYPR